MRQLNCFIGPGYTAVNIFILQEMRKNLSIRYPKQIKGKKIVLSPENKKGGVLCPMLALSPPKSVVYLVVIWKKYRCFKG